MAKNESPTKPLDDEAFTRALKLIEGAETEGLAWTVREPTDTRFKERIERLGFKTFDSDACWVWSLKGSGPQQRPYFQPDPSSGESRTALRYLLASYLGQDIPSSYHGAHLCDQRNDHKRCVRPGGTHTAPVDGPTHNSFDKQKMGTKPLELRNTTSLDIDET